jgi:hypothetical protein
MMVKLSTSFPSGLRHTSHNAARLFSFDMNPHWDLALSLFAPLIETVSRDNATASIYEKLEGR